MKLCCIFNYASNYRLSIYQKISLEFNAHFYFNKKLRFNEKIQKLDFNDLDGFQKELKVFFFYIFEYSCGWIRLAFSKNYNAYIITPNTFAINQWLFLIICKVLGKHVYSWEHGLKSKKINCIVLCLIKIYHNLLSGTFLYGEKAKINMIQLGFNPSKLHLIYNSLDYDKCLMARKVTVKNDIYSVHFNNQFPVLLFIGRLNKSKKLDLVIKAQNALMQKGISTNVIFIGEGPEREYLQELAYKFELEKYIWFRGPVFDEIEIAKYITNATLCVSPGNVGLTAIHAMSYGLPVITHNNFFTHGPEHEAIIENHTGLFFKENKLDDLVTKIELGLTWNNNDQIKNNCQQVIDSKYNTYTQIRIFKDVLSMNIRKSFT